MAQINKKNLKNFIVLLFWMAMVVLGAYFAVKINRRVDSIFDTLRLISDDVSEINSDLDELNNSIDENITTKEKNAPK